jgi:hypothetical protein
MSQQQLQFETMTLAPVSRATPGSRPSIAGGQVPNSGIELRRKGGALTTCQGKDPFDSHELAALVAHRLRGRRDCNVSVYRCLVCSKWHIGSTVAQRNAIAGAHKRALRAIREGEPK